MGRWQWTAHARRTVVTAPLSMCSACVRCRACYPMAAMSTAWQKYARAWVESALMRAMTRVRANWHSRVGGRVISSDEAAY